MKKRFPSLSAARIEAAGKAMRKGGGGVRRVALVHDWLTNMGGAERVVESLLDVYPNAPVYTAMCDRGNLSQKLAAADIRSSFLQKKVKCGKANHSNYLPFMPAAFESFDLNEYDLVISSASCCAKGVVTNPQTMHVCYCHTPPRYAWEQFYAYTAGMPPLKKRLLTYYMSAFRTWDHAAAQRPDFFIANSHNVAGRIFKYYRRTSAVIYPPVDTAFFTPGGVDGDFFLCVSRLVAYKRVDLAVEAFSRLNLPLVVIGEGPEAARLSRLAGPCVRFLGRQSDEAVRDHCRRCRALVFPGEEDFGITPVEAQAAGRPVIAFGRGGARETVLDGQTGLFFAEQTAQSLMDAVRRFQGTRFDRQICRENAQRFGAERFRREIAEFVDARYAHFCQNGRAEGGAP